VLAALTFALTVPVFAEEPSVKSMAPSVVKTVPEAGTDNVDPALGRRLLRLFVELNKSGTSVIIATHDIALMDQFDARRLVLHEGRLHVYE